MEGAEVDLRALKFVDAINLNLICCICQAAFIKPVISTCGHTFCEHCIYQALQSSTLCPIDRTQLSLDDLQPAAKIVSNMVNELLVYCPMHEKGCSFIGQRQFIESHVKNDCQYMLTTCQSEECKELLLKKDMERHAETCKYRILECNMCKEKMPACEMNKHYDSCPYEVIDCLYCETSRPRSEHTLHITECPQFIVSCKHHDLGCSWAGERQSLDKHMSVCTYEALKDYIQQQKRTEEKLRDELRQVRNENESFRRQQLESRQRIDSLTNQLDMMFPGHFTNTLMMIDHDLLANEHMASSSMSTNTIQSPPNGLDDANGNAEPSSSVAPVLSESQQRMNSELETLSANIASLELKQNMALMTETFRLQEELQSLRAICHGLRMQMHYLMMDRRTASTAGVNTAAGSANGASGSGGGTGSSGSGSTGGSVVNSSNVNTATRALNRIRALNSTASGGANKQETKL